MKLYYTDIGYKSVIKAVEYASTLAERLSSSTKEVATKSVFVSQSPVSTLEEGSMISEPRYYGYDDSYYGFDGLYYGYWQDMRVF
jgi:hypothetical protein